MELKKFAAAAASLEIQRKHCRLCIFVVRKYFLFTEYACRMYVHITLFVNLGLTKKHILTFAFVHSFQIRRSMAGSRFAIAKAYFPFIVLFCWLRDNICSVDMTIVFYSRYALNFQVSKGHTKTLRLQITNSTKKAFSKRRIPMSFSNCMPIFWRYETSI